MGPLRLLIHLVAVLCILSGWWMSFEVRSVYLDDVFEGRSHQWAIYSSTKIFFVRHIKDHFVLQHPPCFIGDGKDISGGVNAEFTSMTKSLIHSQIMIGSPPSSSQIPCTVDYALLYNLVIRRQTPISQLEAVQMGMTKSLKIICTQNVLTVTPMAEE